MPKLDLHTHSDRSDGTSAPAQIVQEALRREVSVLALTDHDTASGCDEAAQAAQAAGLPFVCGVEISTRQDDHLHILGLGIDPHAQAMAKALDFAFEQRTERVRITVKQLAEAGVDITFDAVNERVRGSISRAHVADYLKSRGLAQTRQDAFRKFLVPGRPGYVHGTGLDVCAAIAAIKNSGGMAVIAHPGMVFSILDLPAWKTAGLDGLEAFYPAHTVTMTGKLLALADKYGLAVTAGSDYHGPDSGRENTVGMTLSEREFANMRAVLKKWNI
jgi:hypothetical protein